MPLQLQEKWRSADASPAQLSLDSSEAPLRATLLQAECLDALSWARAHGIVPDLCYIDPPFASDRDYHLNQEVVGPRGKEQIRRVAYSDRWPNGLQGYLAFMEPVLESIRDTLSDEGSLLLHCDQRGAPYLAVACDRLFGMGERAKKRSRGFRNELIWTYGLGGSSRTSWPRKHDNILWYTKSEEWVFEPPMVPATSRRMQGQLKKAPDVIAIPTLNNLARERNGYPTQKPLALLELLIGAHSRVGDLVMDVFSGSGTTLDAALSLKRSALVSDRNDDSIHTSRLRALARGCELDVWRSHGPSAWTSGVEKIDESWLISREDTPLVFVAEGRATGQGVVFQPLWEHRGRWGADADQDENCLRLGSKGGNVLLLRDADGREGVVER